MPIPACRFLLPGLLCTLSACQPSLQSVDVSASVPERGSACEDLAYSFYLVAVRRDRGETRREQIDAVERSAESPFVREGGGTVSALTRVIGFVYRNPDASPQQIRQQVRDGCTTNDRGEVVLGRWRTRPMEGTRVSFEEPSD